MNATSYQDFADAFSVDQIIQNFAGNFNDGINACEELCDRWADDSDRIALRYERIDGTAGELSFAELQRRSAQFANYLSSLGIGRGDRVAGLLPRTPELMICVMGVLRAGAVYQPLFTAFGAGAIEYRVQQAQTKLVVTNTEQWPKLADVAGLPGTLLVADEQAPEAAQADALFYPSLEAQSTEFAPLKLAEDDPFLQMFTSGTTGKAKGVAVPLKALMAFYMYMRYAVGLRQSDRFWNVADPGWAYGLYYGIVGPLLLGCTTHFNEAGFTAENTLEFLRRNRINNLAAAPTAYRLLMANEALLADYPEIALERASSAGEPLNPEVVSWMRRVFDCQVYDQYGQTETGMTAGNFHALQHPYRDASMGYAIPGYRLVALDSDFNEVGAGETGELAIDMSQSPLFFFQGYLGGEKKTYHGNYYLTGDLVVSNGDGSHSYTGRDDDIIASAGYRIGPAEVESSLLEHEAVIESGVVGKPHPKRGTIVKAYVVLGDAHEPSEEMVERLQQHVRQRLSTHSYPREIAFVPELPKTSSGKIQRFVLRQRAEQEASSGE